MSTLVSYISLLHRGADTSINIETNLIKINNYSPCLLSRVSILKCSQSCRPDKRILLTLFLCDANGEAQKRSIPSSSSSLPVSFFNVPPFLTARSPWPASVSTATSLLRGTGWFQNLEGTHKSVIDSHHGSSIVKLATVVGR